jgi:hypothetical protein
MVANHEYWFGGLQHLGLVTDGVASKKLGDPTRHLTISNSLTSTVGFASIVH